MRAHITSKAQVPPLAVVAREGVERSRTARALNATPRVVVVVDVVIVVGRSRAVEGAPAVVAMGVEPGQEARGRHDVGAPGSSRRGEHRRRRRSGRRAPRPVRTPRAPAPAALALVAGGGRRLCEVRVWREPAGEKKFSRRKSRARLGRGRPESAPSKDATGVRFTDGVAAFPLSSLHRDPPEVRFRETLASSHAIAKGGWVFFFATSNTNSLLLLLLARLVPGRLVPDAIG